MSWTIISGETGPIHAERNVEILQGDVVDHDVIGPLHEGGVNRQKRLESFCCHTAREESGVFFGNTDIEILVRMFGRKMTKTGARQHRRGDGCDFLIIAGELSEGLPEELRICWHAGFGLLPALLFELAQAV